MNVELNVFFIGNFFFPLPAPSAVPTVHLMGASASTMSLSWLPPDKPNGIILDYEIKYHEKVSESHSHIESFGIKLNQ